MCAIMSIVNCCPVLSVVRISKMFASIVNDFNPDIDGFLLTNKRISHHRELMLVDNVIEILLFKYIEMFVYCVRKNVDTLQENKFHFHFLYFLCQ